MNTISTQWFLSKKPIMVFLAGLLLFLFSSTTEAQLGVYSFTGSGNCPHQNPSVTLQPANAVFSSYTFAGVTCKSRTDEIETQDWANSTNVVNPNEFVGFTITPAVGYSMNLTKFCFTHRFDKDPDVGATRWVLRSSRDNFTVDLATDTVTKNMQTDSVLLPAGTFTNVTTPVTFRLYLLNVNATQQVNWRNDDVILFGTLVNGPPSPPNPTSNSPQCYTNGGTMMIFTGTAPAGQTWYWQTVPNGTSMAISSDTLYATTSGTYYVRSFDNTTLLWSAGAGSTTVIVNQPVGSPVFNAGNSSSRCNTATTIGYPATAPFGISYKYFLDSASISAGNIIDSVTGNVTWIAGYTTPSTITVTATGCDSSQSTAMHSVSLTPNVATPIFSLGTTSYRCKAAGSVIYNASAANNLGITYSIDAASIAGGVTIIPGTGQVTYPLAWAGNTIITASAAGCNGPLTAQHQASSKNPLVSPTFAMGNTSTRCQGIGVVTYTATEPNAINITYTLDANSTTAGNTINSATGTVTYVAGWSGNSFITATATGCNGPTSRTHTVTNTPTVGTPVFSLGATSTRCQQGGASGEVTYTASATNNTGIVYSLDSASLANGNTINSGSGKVTYQANWVGTSVIKATAAGCNGPGIATHTVTITPYVGATIFTLGANSVRCQGIATIIYEATAANSTGITYSLDGISQLFGNTINSATGAVTFTGGWNGTSYITASASGCSGTNSTHTVDITSTVGNPTFSLGSSSTRCRGAGTTTYTANASNNTGKTYSLDSTSLSQGNTINTANGQVTFIPTWTGPSIVSVIVTGCNGPKTASHTITMSPDIAVPVFAMGSSSARCLAAGNVTYSATATNSTSIVYSLDAITNAFPGNSINSTSGQVTYAALWTGTTTITATALGCSGPTSATHTVTINAAVTTPVFALGGTSTRCQGAGSVIYTATTTAATGLTYTLNNAALTAGNTIDNTTGEVNYVAGWTGTTTITATATGCNGPRTANHVVTITPTVGTPVFTLGTTTTRCQLGANVTYAASATNNTGITFTLDPLSLAGGNTINATSGQVTYSATWSGTSTITATASGCNGPSTRDHIANTTPTVGIPVFVLGTATTRCQGIGAVTYTASSSNSTGMVYSLDAASITAGNSINTSTGQIIYSASWSGTSTITASASGCNGPKTSQHIVTITPTVGNPVFASGTTSTRCQGAGNTTYSASSTNSTGMTYSLNAAAISGGNLINPTTGQVTFDANWTGSTIITASAAGCNGPRTSNHTVTLTPTVGTPAFALGLFSSRVQGAATLSYTATATNSTAISYTLDAASLSAGNTINATTGTVTFTAAWFGSSVVTAYAAGCNGPSNSSHTIYINPTVVGIPLYLSDPAQALDRIDPVATNDLTTANSSVLSTTTGGVVVDATSTGVSANPGSTSFSISHTTGTAPNRLLLVSIAQRNQAVTGVTYAGQALTLIGENTATTLARVHIYALINPPTGTNSVVVSFGANPLTGIVVGATTFSGVNQTTPLGTFAGASGTATNASVNINSGIGELVFNAISARTISPTPNAAQSVRYNLSSTNEMHGGAGTLTGAVTVTPSWTNAANFAYAIGGVSIKPAAGIPAITFTQVPSLCSDLIIKSGQNITISNHINIVSGTMPVNPAITAQLRYGANNIITIANPTYNSSTGILTWSGQLGANMTIPAGQAISYTLTTTQGGVSFFVEYDSKTKPSKINLPVITYIDITSIEVYSAPYPGGAIVSSGLNNTTVYVRALVTAPFGASDITSTDFNIAPPGTVFPGTLVATAACTKTFEYAWTTPNTPGTFDITGTAYQGFENSVTRVVNFNISLCTTCPPLASPDSARGAGGAPIILDVLANDYDPNNDIDPTSLQIQTQPDNGSAYLSNGKIIYLPNGTFAGKDTIQYKICDASALCAIGYIYLTIDPTIIDICSDATQAHVYYVPYPEPDSYIALLATSNTTMPSTNIRSIISLTMPYPGMTVVWDEWEDGYEANALNPMQASTKVWGDGNPYNGIVPGYSNDIIPAGGSIVLDNTMPASPRVQTNIFYDGRDKVTASGQIALTQVSGEPERMPVQAIKTNVTSNFDFGQSFTVPLGEDFPSRDFLYTGLFIRTGENNTNVSVDKDNDGVFETTFILNEGQSYMVNGGVKTGATVTSDKPIGVELNAGGVDGYSVRNAPIYPASWYSHTYYTPVPTSDNAANNPKDTSAVMLYNSLNRLIKVNWYSGSGATGIINIPAKSVVRFPLAYSTTAAYKFQNLTGEAFTAIEIVDSYTPVSGGNDGTTYDWSFNLISELRLTDFATTAWAPGGLDMVAPAGPDVNGNPIWVTPNMNTTLYVKWDGDVTGTSGLNSPCGLRYDVSYNVNALNYIKLRDMADNDQSGLAIFTCNGAKIAAVYGEDPQGSLTGTQYAYWDVGTTIQPFCKQKLIFANDDYSRTLVNQPVTIPLLLNDFGFLAVVNPASVNTTGLLQPANGTVTINSNGTVIYLPNPGYAGNDTFEYNVCSTPSPIVCDKATVYVQISTCPAPFNQNVVSGNVFLDKNKDGLNNDGGVGFTPAKVYLYIDGNCNQVAELNELKDSVNIDSSGSYQFITYPEKEVKDNFDGPGGVRTCANGTDGNSAWKSNWVDQGDLSTGYCNTSQSLANTDAEIVKDGAFTNALRLKDRNISATRTVDLSSSNYAFLSFSYRRKSASMVSGDNVIVQASSNGTAFSTIFTIAGDGTTDAAYVDIFNQDISAYKAATTYIRFLTNANMGDNDTVYIDNVSVKFLKYPQCYITAINSTEIPLNYHLTTPASKAMTATSSIFCLAPYDYGVAKNNITVSGTLYNDANGLTDNQVNGSATGYPASTNMYAYLIDSLGKVAFRTPLDPGTGFYSFPIADILTSYTLRISSDVVPLYQVAPTDANLPFNWVSTGEIYGTNNQIATGIKAGAQNSSVPLKTGYVNVSNVNFGIERLPDSDDKTASYALNSPGVLYALPILTGSDPEDGILGSGKAYKITSMPVGAVLYYNGTSVVLNQVITNFDVTKFKIDPDDATYITTFTYASRDAAMQFDPTPATVQVDWGAILPIKLLYFNAHLNGKKVDLSWVTTSEFNASHFEIEKSADAISYSKIGQVAAKGNNTGTNSYISEDLKPFNGLNYYRLKMVDKDGASEYSNVAIIRLENGVDMLTKLGPNPFTDQVEVFITLANKSPIDFIFYDVSGKLLFRKTVQGVSGLNGVTINDLGKFAAGTYILYIKTNDTIITEKLIKK